MSASQPLTFVAYDNQSCRRPEQAYGCDFTDGLADKTGFYRLGLQLYYRPDYIQNAVMTPDMLAKRIRVARRTDSRARPDDVFRSRGKYMYPLRRDPVNALQIAFNVDLLSQQQPCFDQVTLLREESHIPIPVPFRILDSQHEQKTALPVLEFFQDDYAHMCDKSRKRRYCCPNMFDWTKAKRVSPTTIFLL